MIMISPISFNGTGDFSRANGGFAALSRDIRQLLVDSTSGDIYIADSGNHVVRKVDYETGIITTVAGVGQGGYTGT